MTVADQVRGCQECGRIPTCKAHIIPKGFARLIRKANNSVLEVSERGAFKTGRQNGFFDPNILCAACDGKLGALDDWAIKFCQSFTVPEGTTPYQCIPVPNLEREVACRFAVSVFWRSSISQLPQFKGVTLGHYANIARDIAFGRLSVANCRELHVQLNILLSDIVDLKSHIGLPIMAKGKSGPYMIFSAGGLQWLVRFGKMPFGEGNYGRFADALSLNKSLSSVAVAYPFKDSADFEIYRRAIATKRSS